MKRKILSLVLCLAMMVSLAACGGSSEEQAPASDTDSSTEQIVIKISHQNAITHPTQKGLEKFKELLEERSGGTMTCDIYDSAVLGNDTSNLQQVIAGSLDAAMIMGADIWQGYDKRAMIENLPFMFSTYEEADQYLIGTGGAYYEQLAASKGMTMLGLFHNGLKQISNSKKECHLPSDYAGMKIRIPSGEVSMKTFKAFGADPIAMTWGEVYTALQQKTVDGQDNSYMTIASGSIQEVNKYITEVNWQYEFYTLIADSNVFNTWNEATQNLVKEKALEACEWGRTYQEEEEVNIKQDFIDSGVIITELTDTERQAFIDATAEVRSYFIDKYGKEAYDAWGIKG